MMDGTIMSTNKLFFFYSILLGLFIINSVSASMSYIDTSSPNLDRRITSTVSSCTCTGNISGGGFYANQQLNKTSNVTFDRIYLYGQNVDYDQLMFKNSSNYTMLGFSAEPTGNYVFGGLIWPNEGDFISLDLIEPFTNNGQIGLDGTPFDRAYINKINTSNICLGGVCNTAWPSGSGNDSWNQTLTNNLYVLKSGDIMSGSLYTTRLNTTYISDPTGTFAFNFGEADGVIGLPHNNLFLEPGNSELESTNLFGFTSPTPVLYIENNNDSYVTEWYMKVDNNRTFSIGVAQDLTTFNDTWLRFNYTSNVTQITRDLEVNKTINASDFCIFGTGKCLSIDNDTYFDQVLNTTSQVTFKNITVTGNASIQDLRINNTINISTGLIIGKNGESIRIGMTDNQIVLNTTAGDFTVTSNGGVPVVTSQSGAYIEFQDRVIIDSTSDTAGRLLSVSRSPNLNTSTTTQSLAETKADVYSSGSRPLYGHQYIINYWNNTFPQTGSLIGADSSVNLYGNKSNVSFAIGHRYSINIYGNATYNTMTSLQIGFAGDDASRGVVNEFNGILFDTYVRGANVSQFNFINIPAASRIGTGNWTTLRSLYLRKQIQGLTNWQIYSEGGDNYFGTGNHSFFGNLSAEGKIGLTQSFNMTNATDRCYMNFTDGLLTWSNC